MNELKTLDYSGTHVTTAAYVALGTPTMVPTNKLLIADSSGQVVKIAVDDGSIIPAVAATLVNQTITYTAKVAGATGNSITVTIVDPGSASQALAVSLSTNDVQISLQSSAPVKAAKVIQDLTYTAVTGGTAGNGITVTYVNPALPSQALSVTVVSSAITVHLATDGGSALTSTAAQIKAAVDASAPAHALVTVAISGTGSNVQAAQGSTALLGGLAYTLLSTAAQVVAALLANNPIAAVISAATSAGSTVLAAHSVTSLSSGANATGNIVDLFQCPVDQQMILSLPSRATIPVGSQLYLRAISATANSGFSSVTLLS